jgi:Polysaccharide lyase
VAFTSINPLGARLPRAAACLLAAACAILLASALPAEASAPAGAARASSAPHAKRHGKGRSAKGRQRARRQAQRKRRLRRARARRAGHAGVSGNAIVSRPRRNPAASTSSDVLDAGFEQGLFNWNTAGVGEALPTVASDVVRSGSQAGRVVLTGSQGRSELILGGNGGGSTSGMIEFHEGDEYWYGFSFYIESMVYGHPGAHNLIMQFKGDDDGSPAFGLQLWDYEGDDGEYAESPKGLWSHGPAMDGDRFLAPVGEHEWHDVAIHFRASGSGAGFYEVYLDGSLIDSRSGVSMIASGASFAYIKDGLYRSGEDIPGTSELRLDAAKLGHSRESVQPG